MAQIQLFTSPKFGTKTSLRQNLSCTMQASCRFSRNVECHRPFLCILVTMRDPMKEPTNVCFPHRHALVHGIRSRAERLSPRMPLTRRCTQIQMPQIRIFTAPPPGWGRGGHGSLRRCREFPRKDLTVFSIFRHRGARRTLAVVSTPSSRASRLRKIGPACITVGHFSRGHRVAHDARAP